MRHANAAPIVVDGQIAHKAKVRGLLAKRLSEIPTQSLHGPSRISSKVRTATTGRGG